ncbi:unnamed protein product [Schistosoma rodhaini]|uniref:Uncharacterized protein n=1 Tax=Schistosoma rodhaini TaxID=6188 RepID=A0AA85FYS6_9TREM|nr:unnamed protein product [Schistosoma rodhaini]
MRENSTDCMYDCYFFNPLNNNKDTTEFSVCFLSRCNKLFVCVCVFTRKRKKARSNHPVSFLDTIIIISTAYPYFIGLFYYSITNLFECIRKFSVQRLKY